MRVAFFFLMLRLVYGQVFDNYVFDTAELGEFLALNLGNESFDDTATNESSYLSKRTNPPTPPSLLPGVNIFVTEWTVGNLAYIILTVTGITQVDIENPLPAVAALESSQGFTLPQADAWAFMNSVLSGVSSGTLTAPDPRGQTINNLLQSAASGIVYADPFTLDAGNGLMQGAIGFMTQFSYDLTAGALPGNPTLNSIAADIAGAFLLYFVNLRQPVQVRPLSAAALHVLMSNLDWIQTWGSAQLALPPLSGNQKRAEREDAEDEDAEDIPDKEAIAAKPDSPSATQAHQKRQFGLCDFIPNTAVTSYPYSYTFPSSILGSSFPTQMGECFQTPTFLTTETLTASVPQTTTISGLTFSTAAPTTSSTTSTTSTTSSTTSTTSSTTSACTSQILGIDVNC